MPILAKYETKKLEAKTFVKELASQVDDVLKGKESLVNQMAAKVEELWREEAVASEASQCDWENAQTVNIEEERNELFEQKISWDYRSVLL